METTSTRTVIRHRCPQAHRRNPAQSPIGTGCVERCMDTHEVAIATRNRGDRTIVSWAARVGGQVLDITSEPRGSVQVAR